LVCIPTASSKYEVVVQGHRQILADIVADAAGFLERRDADEEALRAALAPLRRDLAIARARPRCVSRDLALPTRARPLNGR
jgi:hypothetical protein